MLLEQKPSPRTPLVQVQAADNWILVEWSGHNWLVALGLVLDFQLSNYQFLKQVGFPRNFLARDSVLNITFVELFQLFCLKI